MIKEKEMQNQNTFFKYDNNFWYDKNYDFEIEFIGSKNGICNLSYFDEVNGEREFIKTLKNMSELKNLYELLSNEEFI